MFKDPSAGREVGDQSRQDLHRIGDDSAALAAVDGPLQATHLHVHLAHARGADR